MKTAAVIMKNNTPTAIILNPTTSKIKHNIDSIRDEWHNQLRQRGQSTEIAFVHACDEILVIK
jgi:3-hydroxy-3-methylglutaryl CoA synthase